MIYEAVRTRLLATANVAAIVGTRIYPLRMPDNGEPPAITLEIATTRHYESMTGSSGLVVVGMALDCWAKGIDQAHDLAEKVRLSLQGFRGTVGGHTIQGITEWRHTDAYEYDIEIYRVSCLCQVWHSEAKPSPS